MRRSTSMQMQPSPKVTGGQRVVAVVGQQIISPERNIELRQDTTQDHVTRHRRNSTSEARRRHRHQYDHVRAPHPYENANIDDPITSYPRSSPFPSPHPSHIPHASQEEGPVRHSAPRRWAPVKREKRPKSSPAPKRTSDSRIDRLSKKTTNSPSSAKRFSTGNVIDKSSEENESKIKGNLRQKVSSPEMQLHTQMIDRYFPTDEKNSNGSPQKEQVSYIIMHTNLH